MKSQDQLYRLGGVDRRHSARENHQPLPESLPRLPLTSAPSTAPPPAGAKAIPGLAVGQLWKVDDAYVQIVDLGQRLIHYKFLRRRDQEAVFTRMIAIEEMAAYLNATGASLAQGI